MNTFMVIFFTANISIAMAIFVALGLLAICNASFDAFHHVSMCFFHIIFGFFYVIACGISIGFLVLAARSWWGMLVSIVLFYIALFLNLHILCKIYLELYKKYHSLA